MKTKLYLISSILFAGLLVSACGNPPGVPLRSGSNNQVNLNQDQKNEFNSFLSKADELAQSESNPKERFPALLLESRIKLGIDASLEARGTCVLFSESNGFDSSDIIDSQVALSPGGKLAYTLANNLSAADCQDIFKSSLASKFEQDFFELHPSLFTY